MPKSQFVSAERLKPLVAYLAIAFVILLVLAEIVPRGAAKLALVAAWFVLFPLGAWLVLKRP